MIQLGIYSTIDSKTYYCIFLPDNKRAQAIGSLPQKVVGSRKVKKQGMANNVILLLTP